jgi:predicted AlkP superfamily pyrophosphatase or phosphodiesterase
MTHPTVFVLLDACRSRYLEEGKLPRMAAFAQRSLYAPGMRPGAGFCERSEILTGASAARTGNFAAYGFDPQASPYRAQSLLLRGLGRLPGRIGAKVATRLTRRLAWRRGITMPPHRIPVAALERFRLTEDARDHFEPRGFAVDSLADRLREAGRTWSWHFTAVGVPNGDDDDRLDALEAALSARRDFYLAYVETIDAEGHRLGPDSPEMDETLGRFDDWFMDRVERWMAAIPGLQLAIVGDHGMTSVDRHLNVLDHARSAARRLGLKFGPNRDVECFLDSTMARFWFAHRSMIAPFRDALEAGEMAECGFVVDRALRLEHEIPATGRLYGDLLWWADPGVLIWPDYFHRATDRVLGMHGYDPEHIDSRGFAIIHAPSVAPGRRENRELRDLAPTLAALLQIEAPRDSQGRDLAALPEMVGA